MVMFNAVNLLSGEGGGGNTGHRIQECWEFVHPAKNVVLNERGGRSECFPVSLLNDFGHRAPHDKQPQFSVRCLEFSHTSRRGSAWPRGLLRGSSLRKHRAQYTPPQKGPYLEGYD